MTSQPEIEKMNIEESSNSSDTDLGWSVAEDSWLSNHRMKQKSSDCQGMEMINQVDWGQHFTQDQDQSLVAGLTGSNLIDFYLEKTLTGSPSDVAYIIKFLYFQEIRFDGKDWYQFKVHKWYQMSHNPLEQIARNGMVNLYLDLANRYNRLVVKYTTESQRYFNLNPREQPMFYPLVINDYIYKSKLCSELCLKLNHHHFYQKVLNYGEQCFYDKDFSVKLDVNPYVIGFDNGNWDLRTRELTLGEAKDRISMSVGYDYKINLMVSQGKVDLQKKIREWFQIHQLEEMINLLRKMLSGCHRQPVIWVQGLDEIGIKFLSNLLAMTLGDYLGELPFWLLRKRKIKYQEAQIDLVENCRKRICLVVQQEDDYPGVHEPMVELLLNEDSMDLRKPREDHNVYVPQFGLVILSMKTESEPLPKAYLFESVVPQVPLQMPVPEELTKEWGLALMKLLLDD